MSSSIAESTREVAEWDPLSGLSVSENTNVTVTPSVSNKIQNKSVEKPSINDNVESQSTTNKTLASHNWLEESSLAENNKNRVDTNTPQTIINEPIHVEKAFENTNETVIVEQEILPMVRQTSQPPPSDIEKSVPDPPPTTTVIENPPVLPTTPPIEPDLPPRKEAYVEIPGENVLVFMKEVLYVSPNQDVIPGILRITNYRIHFEPESVVDLEQLPWFFLSHELFDISLGCIDSISRVAINQSSFGSSGRNKDTNILQISCKDMRSLRFRFPGVEHASKIHDVAKGTAFPLDVDRVKGARWLFAFEYGKAQSKLLAEYANVPSFENSPIQEWVRQGIFASENEPRSKLWRITAINSRFAFAPSYPSQFIVPANIQDEELIHVGDFRSRGRIPAMTYYDTRTAGSLWRCSQPKVGIGSNFCREDEKLWDHVRRSTRSGAGRIFDCRPFKNALGNKAKGFGYEDESRYERTAIVFGNVHNIHTIRSSLEKINGLVNSTSSGSSSNTPGHGWLGSIDATGWLNHIRAVLTGGITVARFVAYNGFSVLVHCSDGWDRTAQVCAVAQLLIDPYFRTIVGFQVLIEKDFLAFGFQCHARIGHGSEASSSDENRSPVFLQFIDSVWQLLRLFPSLFEFNEAYLIQIIDDSFSCKYGTFLGDSERDRRVLKTKQACISAWTELNLHRDRYVNPCYKPASDKYRNIPVLPNKNVVARQVQLWDAFYLRYAAMPSMINHAFDDLQSPYRNVIDHNY